MPSDYSGFVDLHNTLDIYEQAMNGGSTDMFRRKIWEDLRSSKPFSPYYFPKSATSSKCEEIERKESLFRGKYDVRRSLVSLACDSGVLTILCMCFIGRDLGLNLPSDPIIFSNVEDLFKADLGALISSTPRISSVRFLPSGFDARPVLSCPVLRIFAQ